MKRLLKIFLLVLVAFPVLAQEEEKKEEGYQFTTQKEIAITPVKNQASSGTCWAYSGLALIEADLLRMGKGEHDLSTMYVARRNYADKAEKYVRMAGLMNFSQGGSDGDVIGTINEYGLIPAEIYKGLNYGEPLNRHNEIDEAMTGYVKGIVKNRNGKLSTAWLRGFNGILDAYFGEIPEKFTYQGKEYTPQSLAKELGIDSDNYISLTSFTHHPFYTTFALEIQDNWRWGISYNLPIDEFMQCIDYAIEKGHTVDWATDVSEIGFTRTGIAVAPDEADPENTGSDQARWLGLSPKARIDELKAKVSEGPMKEKEITQEMRQIGYDNFETTDDHGMLIYGTAKDQNGTDYYLVKNSWGDTGLYNGIWYASKTFAKYKTLSIVVHKDALSKEIKKKLGL